MSSTRAAARLEAGELFAERYRIHTHLGEGGMGAVYEAHDTRLDERVALKTLSIGADTDERIARFHREVRLARRITHPNVARTHDIGEDRGMHFLTMELIDGCSLDALIDKRLEHTKVRQGPFEANEALGVCICIALGLQAAHEAGVVHRDLKPANVMVEGGESLSRVVITDFGVARALEGDGKRTSGALGTPIYMAPEQILGEAVTTAADIYSLGVIAYEMLTGVLPFDGDTPMAVALARCRVAPTDPREHVDLNAAIAEAVLRCLSMDPQARPQSSADIVRTLTSYSSAASARTVMVTPSRPPSAPGLSSSGSISSPFAPMSPGKRTLGVLPFKYIGPPELAYVPESLAQELIDTLSRTRGLRVLGYGATSAFANASTPDPRMVGTELGADAMVSATLQASPGRVRLSVRLTDVQSGVQLWSDRFDKPFEDVFEMQEVVSMRVADALRVELNLIEHQWRATAEASELYLRARRLLAGQNLKGSVEAVDLLERSVQLSPLFAPAIAARAIAAVGAWWSDIIGNPSTKWDVVCKRYVDEALEHADSLAETHLAAAMYALQMGDMKTTAGELASSLAIAPTLSTAHRYLADLQIECGRLKEGTKRARLALELDPSLFAARMALARAHALVGNRQAYQHEIDRVAQEQGHHNTPLIVMRVRFALWFGDMAGVEEVVTHITQSDDPVQQMVAGFYRYVTGEGDGSGLDAALAFTASFGNVRLNALMGQLVTEAHATVGNIDAACRVLATTAEGSLVDVAWLERCPLLRVLHATPEYKSALTKVRNRANAVWELSDNRSR